MAATPWEEGAAMAGAEASVDSEEALAVEEAEAAGAALAEEAQEAVEQEGSGDGFVDFGL